MKHFSKLLSSLALFWLLAAPSSAFACSWYNVPCRVGELIQQARTFVDDRLREANSTAIRVINGASADAQRSVAAAIQEADRISRAANDFINTSLSVRVNDAINHLLNIVNVSTRTAQQLLTDTANGLVHLPADVVRAIQTGSWQPDLLLRVLIPPKNFNDTGSWTNVYITSESQMNLTAVPRVASCDAGASMETGIQGQVPLGDRLSGRSQSGYKCNMDLVGQYQGVGTDVVSASNGKCAYMPSSWWGQVLSNNWTGVQVVDFTTPAQPRFVKYLNTTRAFRTGTWESLRISPDGTKLAGVSGGPVVDINKFDLYDISDCTNPKLLNRTVASQLLDLTGPIKPLVEGALPKWIKSELNNSQRMLNAGHEGAWSPDSRTYWATSSAGGLLTAIDVSNPLLPRTIFFGLPDATYSLINHGLSFSPDGNTMYLTTIGMTGVRIFDVSSIQNRLPFPKIRLIGSIKWTDGELGQRTTHVTYGGKPMLIATDEGRAGGVRFIDISNPTNPQIRAHIRLEVQLPKNRSLVTQDIKSNGLFGYDVHYCTPDRVNNPTALACGYWNSGIRIFDIRDINNMRETAYFIPPSRSQDRAKLTGSAHRALPLTAPILADVDFSQITPADARLESDMSGDWCSSIPKWEYKNGQTQIWMACMDNGFLVLNLSKRAYATP